MRTGSTDRGNVRALRLAGLAAAVALLTAETCAKDNLGQGGPRVLTFRVSAGANGLQGSAASNFPSISADGRYVAFVSKANNLAIPSSSFSEILVRDRWTDTVENITKLGALQFPTNAADCANPSISANGRFVAYECKGPLTQNGAFGPQPETNIFVYDRVNKTTEVVGDNFPADFWPDADFLNPSISDDGLLVAFKSGVTNLYGPVLSSTQILVADLSAHAIGGYTSYTLVSHATGAPGTESNGTVDRPRISANGQFVVFESTATNLHPDATNGKNQIFVGTPGGADCELVSRASTATGTQADERCDYPVISGDGRFVAFITQSTTFMPGLGTGGLNAPIVLRDRNAPFDSTVVTQDVISLFGFPFDRIGMSDDGRFFTYVSATDILQVRVTDRLGGSFVVSVGQDGSLANNLNGSSLNPSFPTLSADGRWVVWHGNADNLVVGDTNGATDVFGHGPLR